MKTRNDSRGQRQAEALERQAEREKLGDEGQLKKLIRNGHGSCKEAKRLRKRLQMPEAEEFECGHPKHPDDDICSVLECNPDLQAEEVSDGEA